MKLKINKASDLSSISILPPHARRPNTIPAGTQTSQFRLQQQSQQSFSQGISSQPGMFSQHSQNSVDEVLTSSQRYSSQERENSVPKVSTLVHANHVQEENPIGFSRNSSTYMRKWNTTSVSDSRCHINEDLEHRIGLIETSLSRFGLILNSLQSDVMQACKGTKEISLEMESIRQKVISNDNSLQLLSKGQDDIKVDLEGGLKSLSDQLSKAFDLNINKFLEISSSLSALPGQMEASMKKFQHHFSSDFAKEMQAISSLLKSDSQKSHMPALPPMKDTDFWSLPSNQRTVVEHASARQIFSLPSNMVSEMEMGGWTSVKQGKTSSLIALSKKEQKQREIYSVEKFTVQERELVESDDDIGGGFSCLVDEKNAGAFTISDDRRNFTIEEVEVEAERILRKARKRKRKYSNIIIIN